MSESKSKLREWVPCDTNQMRLRHLRQVCARSITLDSAFSTETSTMYFTLHVTTMSAPFYTSEALSGENIDWADLDTRKYPESIVTSCPGIVVQLWVKSSEDDAKPQLVTAWGVYFSGLVYLGSQLPKESSLFSNNSLIFGMSWGYFVDPKSLKNQINNPVNPPADEETIKSYNVSSMCRIHRLQRAIYKEAAESERLRQEIQVAQSNPSRYRFSKSSGRSIPAVLAAPPIDVMAVQELRAQRQAAMARVNMLQQERNRQTKCLEQLRETLKNLRVDNHTRALNLKEKYFHLQMDKERLSNMVKNLAVTEEQCLQAKHQLGCRRRQLLSELSEIFPITSVKDGLYAINDVVLPNSDAFAGCDDMQLSVALGYVAHLVQMISIFLQVPNRYPITVCSSRSRITDNASQRDPGAPREFPLYAKGKDRLYFEYAVYLLNKNIAQLRWLSGLNTNELAATLPNLASLIQHLLTPSPKEEARMKRSESQSERGPTTPRSGSSASVSSSSRHLMRSGGKWQPQRVSRSLAGSQASLADQSMASTFSLDHLTDSPQAGGYFRQPPAPENPSRPWTGSQSSSTFSLDLAVHRPACFPADRVSPFFSPAMQAQHHGSAPDLRSPEAGPAPIASSPTVLDTVPKKETETTQLNGASQAEEVAAGLSLLSPAEPPPPDVIRHPPPPDPLFSDDGMDISARTEALAVCSTFKLKGRGRIPSAQQGNA